MCFAVDPANQWQTYDPASRRMRRLALVDSLAMMCVIFIAGRGGRSMEEAMPTDSGIAFRGCAATRPVIEEPLTWVS